MPTANVSEILQEAGRRRLILGYNCPNWQQIEVK